MWNTIVTYLSEIYVLAIILAVFIWYFYTHSHDPRMPLSRVSLLRMLFLVSVFVFFVLVWTTTLRPGLAATSKFGMFLVDLALLNSLVLALLERPYRDSLAAYCREPEKTETLQAIWSRGKRFYYLRHFISSLTSGIIPTRFLHEMAAGRIRDDVQDCLRSRGLTEQFISLKGLLAHLQEQLRQEEEMPQDFKEMILQDMEKFGSHVWIEQQIDEYLRMALEAPEKIHNPEWSRKWEETRESPKS